MITESSTFNVNIRQLLVFHELTSSTLYLVNGLMMTLVFFLVRIVFYTWIITYKFYYAGAYSRSFWETYDPEKRNWLIASVVVYDLMFSL